MADAGDEALRRRVLIVDAVRFSGFAGALVSIVVTIWGPLDLAISIMLGTLLGAANFVLLARGVGAAIDRTVEEVERSRREPGRQLDTAQVVRQARGAGSAMRLAFVVLLIAAVLWYPGTQPLGLAIGVIIVLIAASFAAAKENRQRTSQNAS